MSLCTCDTSPNLCERLWPTFCWILLNDKMTKFKMVVGLLCIANYVFSNDTMRCYAITSDSLWCMHRLTITLAAHFLYLRMIKHGLTCKWWASSRHFFFFLFFLFSALDSCCLFEAISKKVDSLLSNFIRPNPTDHWDSEGHHRYFHEQLNISLVLPVLWYTCLNIA